MNMEKTILIIDDDVRNIFALTAILKSYKFKTVSATNMVTAFELLDIDKKIGLVLIDMMMPGMDGYEAIPKLKSDENYKHLPVISVTAQAMTGDRERILATGADDYIAKPVDVDKMLDILKRFLK